MIREERNHVFSDSSTIIDFALSADATGIFVRKRSWGRFLAWDCKWVVKRREEHYNQLSHWCVSISFIMMAHEPHIAHGLSMSWHSVSIQCMGLWRFIIQFICMYSRSLMWHFKFLQHNHCWQWHWSHLNIISCTHIGIMPYLSWCTEKNDGRCTVYFFQWDCEVVVPCERGEREDRVGEEQWLLRVYVV